MDEDVGTGVGPSERVHHAGAGGSTPERRRRMSARRKQEAVLRLLRGEDLELLARQLGVTAADLSGWRGAFLAAGEVSLKNRPTDARDDEIGRLKAKVGDLTMANELLEAKIERLETARPLARRRSRPTPRDGSRGDPGGDEPPGLALRRQDLWPAAGDADLGRVAGDHLPPSPLSGRCEVPEARTSWRDGGQGLGGGDPAAPAGQPVPWRRLPQAMAATALGRHLHQPAPRPAAHTRAWPAGPSACRPPAWLAGPRRQDHHRAGRRHVGHRPDQRRHWRRPSGL